MEASTDTTKPIKTLYIAAVMRQGIHADTFFPGLFFFLIFAHLWWFWGCGFGVGVLDLVLELGLS